LNSCFSLILFYASCFNYKTKNATNQSAIKSPLLATPKRIYSPIEEDSQDVRQTSYREFAQDQAEKEWKRLSITPQSRNPQNEELHHPSYEYGQP
jgi:hypothetical protein